MLKEQKILQVQAVVIVKFLAMYSELENMVKAVFGKRASACNNLIKNKLHFYYGSMAGKNLYIEYSSGKVRLNEQEYGDEAMLKVFDFNKIVKIDEQEHLISEFDTKIQSIQTPALEYPFRTCCMKLINMRNVLAHEMVKLSFKDKHYVEMLSDGNISKNKREWLLDEDYNNMNDETKQIYCNIIYMEHIMRVVKGCNMDEAILGKA